MHASAATARPASSLARQRPISSYCSRPTSAGGALTGAHMNVSRMYGRGRAGRRGRGRWRGRAVVGRRRRRCRSAGCGWSQRRGLGCIAAARPCVPRPRVDAAAAAVQHADAVQAARSWPASCRVSRRWQRTAASSRGWWLVTAARCGAGRRLRSLRRPSSEAQRSWRRQAQTPRVRATDARDADVCDCHVGLPPSSPRPRAALGGLFTAPSLVRRLGAGLTVSSATLAKESA